MRSRLAIALGLVVLGGSTVFVGTAAATGPIGGTPSFTVYSPGGPRNAGSTPAPASTVPLWNGSFTFHGVAYHYAMVGASPGAGSSTTTVADEILPLTMTFASGPPLTASRQATSLSASPIFVPTAFTSGRTQFADAMQRAEFWNDVSKKSKDYHVLLAKPTMLAPATIAVPRADGKEYTDSALHVHYAYIKISYFQAKLQAAIDARHLNPKTLALVVVGNVFLYLNNTSQCCVYGFHGAIPSGAHGAQTFAFGNFLTEGLTASPILNGVYTFSHEVAEWMNDPLTDNIVPRWVQPGTGECYSDLLEVGDPLEALQPPGYSIVSGATTWHVTDTAGVSWFSHAVPSAEQNHKYSYHGFLTSPSTHC